MLTRQALVLAGGLLLRAATDGQNLVLGLEPNFVNGVRAYHYDMAAVADAELALTGGIDANGKLTLLPILAPSVQPTEETRERLATLLGALARALMDGGLDGRCPISQPCQAALAELKICQTPPASLAQLAETFDV